MKSLKNRCASRINMTVFVLLIVAITVISTQRTAVAEPLLYKVTVSGSGAPVVLIPGLMSDGRVWDATVRQLESSHQVHLIELLGFGRNPVANQYSLASLEAQLTNYVRALDRPVLIGHSLGGFLSMSMALALPKSIDRVMSVDGLPFIGPVFTGSAATQANDLAAQAAQIKAMFKPMTNAQFEAQIRSNLPRHATAEQTQRALFNMARQSNPGVTGQFMASIMARDLREQLSELTCPLLILGASGGFANPEAKQHVQALYQQQIERQPMARVVMHPQARHFIMWDDPDWFADQIALFLNEDS